MNIEYIVKVFEKFIETFIIKYEYDKIGIIKKFRIDSRKNLEFNEDKWCKLFLKKSCLNYCAKFLLLRVLEDKGKITSKLNKKGIDIWNKLVKNIKDRYDILYDIAVIDMKNEEEISGLKNIFLETDYDIYEIDKELAQIIVDGFSHINFQDVTAEDLKEIFRIIHPLDEREEMKLQDFYHKAPALEYILNLD
ncbi:MAG: hypothetical protein PWQ37_1002 [Candidatus Petromonas sp.]|nr:hypothetical protein [Candidatus Petromonas sp.]